jgi:predicted transcriptional regulator
MTVVSLELDDKLAGELKQLSESLQTSEVDLVRKAVDNFLRQQRMDQIRAEIKPYAEAAGLLTEEDIYKEIS